jgi:hypothetical protein
MEAANCVMPSCVIWRSPIASPSSQRLSRTTVFAAQKASFDMGGTCGSSPAILPAYSSRTKTRQRQVGNSVKVFEAFVSLHSRYHTPSQGATSSPFRQSHTNGSKRKKALSFLKVGRLTDSHHRLQGRKTLGRRSRRAEIKGVNVASSALPDAERFS